MRQIPDKIEWVETKDHFLKNLTFEHLNETLTSCEISNEPILRKIAEGRSLNIFQYSMTFHFSYNFDLLSSVATHYGWYNVLGI